MIAERQIWEDLDPRNRLVYGGPRVLHVVALTQDRVRVFCDQTGRTSYISQRRLLTPHLFRMVRDEHGKVPT